MRGLVIDRERKEMRLSGEVGAHVWLKNLTLLLFLFLINGLGLCMEGHMCVFVIVCESKRKEGYRT